MNYYFKPVNHPNNSKPDWDDSTKKDLQSISSRIHQIQLTHNKQGSTT